MNATSGVRLVVAIGRLLLFLAVLALLAAWLTQVPGTMLLGMSQ